MENKDSKNNFNHPAVIVTILILVFIGGYFLLNKNSNTPQDNTPNPQQSEIDALKKTVEDLKNQKPQTIVKEVPAKTGPDLATIVSEWRNRTAYLLCSGVNSSTGQNYTQSATAYIAGGTDGVNVYAVTNRHAVTDSVGDLVSNCAISIPDAQNSISITYKNILLSTNSLTDVAFIDLGNTDPYLKLLISQKKKYCFRLNVKPSSGDQILILGYPAIGSSADVTATEGIISSYDYPYYVTSAKIDHGNSGGVAILVKDDCWLGIPTGSVVGSIESLGRILDAEVIVKLN